jgi:hypothetical protein
MRWTPTAKCQEEKEGVFVVNDTLSRSSSKSQTSAVGPVRGGRRGKKTTDIEPHPSQVSPTP